MENARRGDRHAKANPARCASAIRAPAAAKTPSSALFAVDGARSSTCRRGAGHGQPARRTDRERRTASGRAGVAGEERRFAHPGHAGLEARPVFGRADGQHEPATRSPSTCGAALRCQRIRETGHRQARIRSSARSRSQPFKDAGRPSATPAFLSASEFAKLIASISRGLRGSWPT